MSLKGIMTISGQSGLFKVVAQTKSGYIVESMLDHKKSIVQSTQKISMLDDISVYTSEEDKPLKDVLLMIKEKTGNDLPVTPKSEPAELKKYFKTIVPDFDEERVYSSDIKKIISWYGLLKDIITKDEEEKKEAPGTNAEAKTEAVIGQPEAEQKLSKKPTAKPKKKNGGLSSSENPL